MRRIFLVGLFVAVLNPSFSSAEIKELEVSANHRVVKSRVQEKKVDFILCVDGFKVFQTVAMGTGGDGAGVSNVQLMEERDGKLVPVRCSGK